MQMNLNAIFYRGSVSRCDYLNTGAAIANGAIVDMGQEIGICTSPEGIAIGSSTPVLGSLAKTGVFRLKKSTTTGLVWNQGERVYWDTANNTAVKAPGSNIVFAGIADESAGQYDGDVKTDINKVAAQDVESFLDTGSTTTTTTTTAAPTTTTT